MRFKARIEKAFAETPLLVVDKTRLSQAFLNILLNAAQAISGKDPDAAWIRVETHAEHDGVSIVISNNGPGCWRMHSCT